MFERGGMRKFWRRHHRKETAGPEGSAESLTDMMCSVIGILTIVLLFAVIAASRPFLGGVVDRDPEGKVLRTFEACDNRITFVDRAALIKQVAEGLQRLRGLPEEERLAALVKLRVSDGNYRVTPEGLPHGFLRLVPEGAGGTPEEQLADPHAAFCRRLDEYDPKKNMLMFVVRMDSWRTYLRAKEIANARGFLVTKEIRDSGSPIIFHVFGSGVGAE